MQRPAWIEKLRQRWKVESVWQVMLILMVFACTGYTIVFISKPVLNYLYDGEPVPVWAKVIYYILIFPIYNLVLLFYGFIFGQFKFFWAFEKRFLKRFSRRESDGTQ
jgi:hypothetical protein